MNASKAAPLLLLPLALLLAACTTFDARRARQDQSADYSARLDALAADLLARPLSLDDCIRIAVSNNYAARLADLDLELARLGKAAAFSVFLPRVTASVGYSDNDFDAYLGSTRDGGPVYQFAGAGNESALALSWPVFMPSTWFLYAAARHGYAATEIAAFYTRQSIALQATARYYDVLVQQDTVAAIETQLESAREFADRTEGLAREGYAADWELGQARLQAESRATELARARRQLGVLRAQLLQTLGLPPRAAVELLPDDSPAPALDESVDDLVLLALSTHPALAIADRQVVMKEHAVRQAFCDFLPTLGISATHKWAGKDLEMEALGWSTGFSAAWSVFNGFANLASWKSAKTELAKTEIERENSFLSIIVSVVSAEAALRDAEEAAALRRLQYDTFSAKYADKSARAAEGLIPLSDALDARAEMDLAQVALVRSRFQAKMARASLDLAVGRTAVPGMEHPLPPESAAANEPKEQP